MLKFLADENIAPRVIQALQDSNYDIGPVQKGISDDEIIIQAEKENRVILTHDKDFGNLLHFPLQKHSGVILIRLSNQSPDNVIAVIIPLIKELKNKCQKALVVVKERSIRIIK